MSFPISARHWTLAAFLAIIPSTYGFASAAEAPLLLALDGDIAGVHDPAVGREGAGYFLYATGAAHPGHIAVRCSKDMRHWALCGRVFDELPKWVASEVPGATTAWAPDVSLFNGHYRLYYSVSTFGSNDSAIGLAINETLDPASPRYRWVDQGMVLRSRKGVDDWNAIDPNVASDEQGRLWLVFGSFWGGIKMRLLDSATGKLSGDDQTLYSLAARRHEAGQPDAIEAPFLIRHGGYFYLFVSFDFCCRGAKSTYYVAVGRSRVITGPYLDRTGKSMLEGGGARLTAGTALWRGPGHEAVLSDSGQDYLLFHAYDGSTGKPSLQISTMTWEDRWPRVAALPN